jgi:pimeloyl-ACP methyl ester carboxylesterase
VPFSILFVFLLSGACSNDNAEPQATAAVTTPAEVTATAPASTPEPAATATLTPAPPIAWSACQGFECADYDVPLDYAHPEQGTITLAVKRLPASDPSQRVGALFANPGGPGGSAIDILSGWARNLPQSIRARFDIVLFDPRGVGQSSPLLCGDDVQKLIGLEPYPETDEDWQAIEDAIQEMAGQCAQAGSDILPFLGTESVARDMDRLREAMGDEELTYFGYSYGTTIGQVYADLFPTHVRAMVLDGAVDINIPADQRALEQTVGFEAAFNRYLADCKAKACLPGDPATQVNDLIAKSELSPIPAATGDRPVGPGELVFGILGSLYSKASWPLLTTDLNAALKGDASGLLFIVDSYVGRNGDGTYDNSSEMNTAVNCLDYVNSRDTAHYRQLAVDFAKDAPFFGPATGQLGLYCAYWQPDPKPLRTPRAPGAPPILVIGNTGDPATPYKWAVAVSQELEFGVLLTNDAEGHTAYRMGSGCVDDVVNAYLLDLTPPDEGKTCGSAGIEPAPPVNP